MSKKEQILEYFKDINVAYNDYTMHDTLEHMLEDLEEVRHGHWIKDDTGAEYCSNCHEYPYDDGEYHIVNWHSDYCPHCGADMMRLEDAEIN